MTEIHLLNASVYNKIAAGEVVEKPASVVKELVENALDAKADSITIAISGGGLSSIEVSDNGEGIAKDQLTKVFLPHATSKIATDKDLFGIETLGFRGEAMASIAAVSQVKLTSRVKDEDAFCITADGGNIGTIEPIGASFGTTVCVRNLFYHTPARLKFLRSESGETHDVTQTVQRLILANPAVAFRYSVDGKMVLQSDGTGLESATRAVLGDEVFDHLLPVEASEYGYSVHGYVSDTLYSMGTKAMQFTILNSRVISNVNLHASIANAYRDYLMKRQFALYVLHISIPSSEVDVNVHPTKADVRFEYGNKLFGFVYRTVKKALEESIQQRNFLFELPKSDIVVPNGGAEHIELRKPSSNEVESVFCEGNEMLATYRENMRQSDPLSDLKRPNSVSKAYVSEENEYQNSEFDLLSNAFTRKEQEENAQNDEVSQADVEQIGATYIPNLRLVGQVFGTYLIAEVDGAMMLVDQHAAAERVLYDRLVQEYTQNNVSIQPLLVPYEFDLVDSDAEILAERIQILVEIGVEIERKGECRFAVDAIPSLLVDMDMEALIRLILAEQPSQRIDLFKEKLAYAACRSAIKGNTYMDNDAAMLLLQGLFGQGIPSQCPHGRPAYIQITQADLEKMFRRKV